MEIVMRKAFILLIIVLFSACHIQIPDINEDDVIILTDNDNHR